MARRRFPVSASRAHRRIGTAGAALTLVVLGSACTPFVASQINNLRTAAGRPTLPSDSVMEVAAHAHADSMCAARAVSASPAGSYVQKTSAGVHELVGAAPLDPSIANAADRNIAASKQIWAAWQSDAALTGAEWTDLGVGETTCADGKLYMTAVLRAAPSMPASGLYSTPQYDASTIQQFVGIQYATAVDYTGTTIPLLLDVYVPPASAPSPRPVVILVHGGAFVGGSRSDYGGVARSWATRGYDVVAIDYRLDQSLRQDSSPPKEVAAASAATADGEQAARWVKANAATYGADPTRIAAVGDSAGGAIALGMSAAPDFQAPTTGPLAPYSSKIAAAVSTGAYLTPALDLGVLHLTAGLAPILMFHYETDVASNTGEYAFRTCSAYRAAGSTCDYVSQPGEGHTTDVSPTSVFWPKPLGPFIWQNLHLAG